ncbi:MAG: mannitol dehydrogenase family protein [Pseudomonadota bacterium]
MSGPDRPMRARLSDATLAQAQARAETPAYARGDVACGIVHLGLGAFHRAHMAAYVDTSLASDPRWGITGVSLRSDATRAALTPQNGLYTLTTEGAEGARHRIIGSVLSAVTGADAARAALLAPETKIVSMTVTEKGYRRDPATGRLNLSDPDVAADIAGARPAKTLPGVLVRALSQRRAEGLAPPTLLSCDNLPSNGATLRRILLDFVAEAAPGELTWFEDTLACPSTMVDRIVPATTDEARAAASAAIGLDDEWPVIAEPFTQFVVEDRFAAGRPDWEAAGVTMTDDVAPYEAMKLRMLNGAHSTLAYLGYLAGFETVAEAMADPPLRRLITELMEEEIAPTLTLPPGVDALGYGAALRERFDNPALRHRTWQIAMDGSQKLPQRLLATLRDRRAAGRGHDRLALGVAAWIRYAAGRDEAGQAIDVRDPLADRFREIAGRSDGPEALARRFLALEDVFGADLSADAAFADTICGLTRQLFESGVQGALSRMSR